MTNPPERSGALGSLLGDAAYGKAKEIRHPPGEGLTPAQHARLHWLNDRNGTGVLLRHRYPSERFLLAAGEVAKGAQKKFWDELVRLGYMSVEGDRYSLTHKAYAYCIKYPVSPELDINDIRSTGRVDPKPPME